MIRALERFFEVDRHGTTVGREAVAGLTTFVTMAYIIVVNPKILEAAGMPFGPAMAATILTAAFGTLAMGLYAKRPFAIAPYMGENAFIVFTVVRVLGYSWQTAFGAVFLAGLLFTLITVFKVRVWLAEAIPQSLKIGFAVGIGLFLTFVGLNETGIVRLGVEGAPVRVGDLGQSSVLLAIFGFLFMGWLMILRMPAAILAGIVVVTAITLSLGLAPVPDRWVSLPPDLSPLFLQLDVVGALTWGMFGVVLTIFVMSFVDTIGTLIALGYKANLVDANGNLPEIEKPMLCDAVTTTLAPLLGTSTSGAYIESATGLQAGGRTGLTAVVTALLFLSALFFAPAFAVVPPCAYGPALIVVGLLMVAPVTQLNFDALDEIIPAFTVIVLMSFTFNIGIGMTAGFVVYPLLKLLIGRARDVKAGSWVLAALSLLFFAFYPY
jgi:AGZA family xanthine/uracil permease-like MFS transporter